MALTELNHTGFTLVQIEPATDFLKVALFSPIVIVRKKWQYSPLHSIQGIGMETYEDYFSFFKKRLRVKWVYWFQLDEEFIFSIATSVVLGCGFMTKPVFTIQDI